MPHPGREEHFKAAIKKLKAAAERYFYPDGTHFREDVPPAITAVLTDFLNGVAPQDADKVQVLIQTGLLCEHNEVFFQQLQREMVRAHIPVDFYSEINTHHDHNSVGAPHTPPKGLAAFASGRTPLELATIAGHIPIDAAGLLDGPTESSRPLPETPVAQSPQEEVNPILSLADNPDTIRSHIQRALKARTGADFKAMSLRGRDTSPEGVAAEAQSARDNPARRG